MQSLCERMQCLLALEQQGTCLIKNLLSKAHSGNRDSVDALLSLSADFTLSDSSSCNVEHQAGHSRLEATGLQACLLEARMMQHLPGMQLCNYLIACMESPRSCTNDTRACTTAIKPASAFSSPCRAQIGLPALLRISTCLL